MVRAPLILSLSLLCVASLGGCERKPCARDCEWFGLCTPQGDQCVAAKDADCHGSKDCNSYGKCSAKDGKCKRLSEKDCQRSNKCGWAGECGFLKGECTARNQADCQRSKFCKDKGFCTLKRKRSGRAVCVN